MNSIDLQKDTIPFGKYKGQPLEVIQNDAKYCDWLMAQDWFRDRHAPIYQLIVNNFGESSETPEHNKLQTLFLDDKVCLNLLRRISWKKIIRQFEYVDTDVLKPFMESKNKLSLMEVVRREFECGGWDVAFGICIKGDKFQSMGFAVEIKPSIGDDYPAILRQMKMNSRRCCEYSEKFLVFEKFSAVGASKEDVVKIFNESGFHAIQLSEIINTGDDKNE